MRDRKVGKNHEQAGFLSLGLKKSQEQVGSLGS